MHDEEVRERRKAMLRQPHVAKLTDYAATLRERGSIEVPEFDPLDGGIEARALFLFEKPGPMTATDGNGKRSGSRFISRNNDDPTAEATFNFMQQAGIERKQTVIWNVIPWWNYTRKVSRSELSEGVECVKDLIDLLTKLSVVVMVGQKAARAKSYLETTRLALITSDHPGPLVRARFPERWKTIPAAWSKVHPHIDEEK